MANTRDDTLRVLWDKGIPFTRHVKHLSVEKLVDEYTTAVTMGSDVNNPYRQGAAFASGVIAAEISARFDTVEELLTTLDDLERAKPDPA